MGDEHERGAAPRDQLEEQVVHRVAGPLVEAAARLVRQQDAGLDHQRARERHALALAAREPRGQVIRARRPARPAQRRTRARLGVGGAAQLERQAARSRARVEPAHQVEALEHDAEPARAQRRQLALGERGEYRWPSMRTLPRVGTSSPASSASSVDLPLPDSPTHRDGLARRHLEVDAAQHLERAGRRGEVLVDVARAEHGGLRQSSGSSTASTLSATRS